MISRNMLAAIGVIVPLSLGTVLLSCTKPATTTSSAIPPVTTAVSNIEHDLPKGTPSKDVDAYLKKSGLEYSFDKPTNAYYAMKRRTGGGGLVTEDTQIVVKLDSDEKVAEVSVKPVYTGP